jgi:hypothetical protein
MTNLTERFADICSRTTFSPDAFMPTTSLVIAPPSGRARSYTLPLVSKPFQRARRDIPDPNLELHSAAASGNVGLAHYALTHGQPVNSLLHGCLPLHAASSGGDVTVVRLLLQYGADVNAPRLPRRYSENKRSSQVPAVGTAGECPSRVAPNFRLYTSPLCRCQWALCHC